MLFALCSCSAAWRWTPSPRPPTSRSCRPQLRSCQREGRQHLPATCRGHGDCVLSTPSQDALAESKGAWAVLFLFFFALELCGQITFLSLGMSQEAQPGSRERPSYPHQSLLSWSPRPSVGRRTRHRLTNRNSDVGEKPVASTVAWEGPV